MDKVRPKDDLPLHQRDPASGDTTVELTRDFLAEHSAELLSMVERTGDGLRPRDALSNLWSAFEEDVPTAQVRYLGEDDPDSYDFEDLVDPPTPQAIQNLLTKGREVVEAEDDFFVDLEALEELSDWAVGTLEAPSTDAVADRMHLVNQIVARSRALSSAPVSPPSVVAVVPPSPPLLPPDLVLSSPETQELEEWQFEDEQPSRSMEPVVVHAATTEGGAGGGWVGRLAGLALAIVAGWAFAMGVALPVTAALVVGALALLILPGRG